MAKLQYFAEKPDYKRFISKIVPIVFTQCKRAKNGGYYCMPDLVGFMPIRLYGSALLFWLIKNKQKTENEKASLPDDAISRK